MGRQLSISGRAGIGVAVALFAAMQVHASIADDFVPDTALVAPTNFDYVDPEFVSGGNKVAFQDDMGAGWVGVLDPVSGLFKGPNWGHDLKFDTGLVPRQSNTDYLFNGPEWGTDKFGTSLFYTKRDAAGVPQTWRAEIQNGTPVAAQLTTYSPGGTWGAVTSTSLTAPLVTLLVGAGVYPTAPFGAWFYESAPNQIHKLPHYSFASSGCRMVPGSATQVTYSYVMPNGTTQVALLDTKTGAVQVLTNDTGSKADVWAFYAPEFGGEMLIVATIDRTALGIYRNLGDPSGYWTRIAELAPPQDQPQRYLYSSEPIDGARGLDGVSYFSVAALVNNNRNNPGDAGMWILGLDGLARRVDDGALSGQAKNRFEPETHLVSNELFLYYNAIAAGGKKEFWRAHTGLFVDP